MAGVATSLASSIHPSFSPPSSSHAISLHYFHPRFHYRTSNVFYDILYAFIGCVNICFPLHQFLNPFSVSRMCFFKDAFITFFAFWCRPLKGIYSLFTHRFRSFFVNRLYGVKAFYCRRRRHLAANFVIWQMSFTYVYASVYVRVFQTEIRACTTFEMSQTNIVFTPNTKHTC